MHNLDFYDKLPENDDWVNIFECKESAYTCPLNPLIKLAPFLPFDLVSSLCHIKKWPVLLVSVFPPCYGNMLQLVPLETFRRIVSKSHFH